jgi:tripartite-type tricarboxylate transporter receptor subunit TctC
MKSLLGLLAIAFAAASAAQDYPSKPIRMVVGFPPGGGTDVAARILAPKLSEQLGQPVVIENRPGATGTTAAAQVASSPGDGYTIMMGHVSVNAIAPSLFPKLGYDVHKDFAPIGIAASVPHIVTVHPSLQVNSLRELLAHLRANQGKLSFPSAGNGSMPHLAGEVFKNLAGVNLLHVPYKGTGQSMQDLLGGVHLVAFDTMAAAAPDGYALYVTTLTHSVNAVLHADKKPYDPIADFTPITLVCHLPLVMVTKGDSPFNTAADVVNAAKAKPGEVSYASSGTGGSAHLAGALVEALTRTKMTHVPFKGNAPALTEVIAGRISYMFYPMVGIAEQVSQKRLKVLGVSTARRHPDYPAVPTMSESGFPGFEEYTQGLGVVGPAGIPVPVVARLNEAIRASLQKADTKEKLRGLGAITEGGSTPAEFRAWLAKDLERWARVIQMAGVKAE